MDPEPFFFNMMKSIIPLILCLTLGVLHALAACAQDMPGHPDVQAKYSRAGTTKGDFGLFYVPDFKHPFSAWEWYQNSKQRQISPFVKQQPIDMKKQAEEIYRLGFDCQQKSDFDCAIKNYLEACNICPAEAAYRAALATAYDNKGDFDNAIANYEKAISMNPKEKQLQDALRSAKQRKAQPFVQDAYRKQTTLDANGIIDLKGAIESYERALEIIDDPSVHLNLGTAYEAAGDKIKADEQYKKAGSLYRGDQRPFNPVGDFVDQRGKPISAPKGKS